MTMFLSQLAITDLITGETVPVLDVLTIAFSPSNVLDLGMN